MYGFVARGLKNANASRLAYVMFAMGGDYLTPDGKSALNSPGVGQGLEYYSRMLRRYAPPGVVNFNWYECSSAFMQGQVAHVLRRRELRHPVRGQGEVQDRRQGGLHAPARRSRRAFARIFTNAMAVSAQSKNKEAA